MYQRMTLSQENDPCPIRSKHAINTCHFGLYIRSPNGLVSQSWSLWKHRKGRRAQMDFVFCALEKEQKERSFGDALRNIVKITSFTTNARSYLVFSA